MVSIGATVHSHRYLAEYESEEEQIFFELDSFVTLGEDHEPVTVSSDPVFLGTLSSIDINETEDGHELTALFIERGDTYRNFRGHYKEVDIEESTFFEWSEDKHQEVFEENDLSSIVLSNQI